MPSHSYMNPARLEIQLSYPTTSDHQHPKADASGRYVSLRITDSDSGQILAEVELSGVEFTAMLAASYVHADRGFVGQRLDRVGKTYQHDVIHLGYIPHTKEGEAKVAAECAKYTDAWEVVEPRRHNTGTAIHLARWAEKNEKDG